MKLTFKLTKCIQVFGVDHFKEVLVDSCMVGLVLALEDLGDVELAKEDLSVLAEAILVK